MTSRPAYTLRRLRELGFRAALGKLFARRGSAKRASAQRSADSDSASFALDLAPDLLRGPIVRLIEVPARVPGTEWIEPVCDEYVEHFFDVLGSGWTHVLHGMECAGIEGIAFEPAPCVTTDPAGAWLREQVSQPNLREARRIWAMVDDHYVPIDWHVDIKSGYRWDPKVWYGDIAVAPARGADIKVPWELARCHHLPQMALLAGWSESQERDALAGEFRNQILDFIATNAPRYGVNWACAMDVGIRVANWLVAHDIFVAAGADFDEEFESVFVRSIFEHARHLRANLEGDDTFRGNHYYADLTGLLFCAAYLGGVGEGPEPEVSEWWDFASSELLSENRYQFLLDGGNYEGSTGYHRLTLEMALYAAALIVRVEGEDAVPTEVSQRLERAAGFVRDTATPAGMHPQIGDDDSGRLFKFGVRYQWTTRAEAESRFESLTHSKEEHGRYWVEEHRDHRHLLAAAGSLFGREDLLAKGGQWLDRELIGSLSGGLELASSEDTALLPGPSDEDAFANASKAAAERPEDHRIVQSYEVGGGVGTPSLCAYPEFGLYVFRSHRFYLAVRCGRVGQNGLGGHAHNDQLGIVLNSGGIDEVVDPGTYLYTPLPERRNEYRSVKAHNAPSVEGREPVSLAVDLFRLDDVGATCVYFGERGFAGYHKGYGSKLWRVIEFADDTIRITDFSEDETATLMPPVASVPNSPGYGIRERGAM